MRLQQREICRYAVGALAVALFALLAAVPAQAAITWDGAWDGTPEDTSVTHWWFDGTGWTEDGALRVPPVAVSGEGTPEDPYVYSASSSSDVLINGTGPWDQGEGVVYDPTNDPNYAATAARSYWSLPAVQPYTPQTIWRLYIARNPTSAPSTADTKLTIKGDLSTDNTLGDTRWQLGRSSGTQGVPATGIIVQESGTVINGYGDIDLGSSDTSPGDGYFGNGTYDYRSGTFEHGLLDTGSIRRFRLSAGGSTATGGIGTLIVHNPDTPGHFRVKEMYSAAYAGGTYDDPDGVIKGVAISEFHYANGGTRPVQVDDNLQLANGQNNSTTHPNGWRSSQLRLVLDEAPIVDVNGVPIDLGLFDTGSDGSGGLIGPGGTPSSFGVTFSDADAIAADTLDPLASHNAAYVYNQGGIVTAMFGASTYRWQIYYDGNITWTNRDDSTIASITGGGTGSDIVLIGLDSVIVQGLLGDYNGDDIVDAADYTVWRDVMSAGGSTLTNDPTPGTVDESDYTYWKNHFGETLTPGSGALVAGAVPEPSSLVLLVMAAVLWLGRGLVSRR